MPIVSFIFILLLAFNMPCSADTGWLEKAQASLMAKAEAGDIESQFILGSRYKNGTQVQQDYAEAVKWWQKAADQGDERAQEHLAGMYEEGKGVAKSQEEATKWFRAALESYRKKAEQGDINAQLDVGVRYWSDAVRAGNTKRDGYFGSKEKNFEAAAKWFRIAADNGDTRAMHWLSGLYAYGNGVPLDRNEAMFWTLLGGNDGGTDAYISSKDFSPEQMEIIRKRIAEWLKTHHAPFVANQ